MTLPWRAALVVVAAAAACYVASTLTRGDPLFIVEVGVGGSVAVWAATALVLLRRSARLAVELSTVAETRRIHGIECQVVADVRPLAFVAGGRRPQVFLSTGAIHQLAPGELLTVLLHESHHARAHAPARSAFVEAWAGIARVIPRLGPILVARLDAFEIHADRAALSGGARREDLASALVKFDLSPPGVGFAGGGQGRIRALLAGPADHPLAGPVEWLPLLVAVGLLVGCRLAGTSGGL